MTAVAITNNPAAGKVAHRVTWPRVLRSEWIKLSSLRSTRVTLLISFVLTAGIGILAAAITAANWPHLAAAEKASFDPVSTVLDGYMFGQLAVGVLGVLVISNEYSSGMIRATLTAVPRRLPVLWSKTAVFTAVTLIVMTAASFTSFYAGMAVLSGHHLSVALSDPGVLRAVAGCGLYLAVIGLLGVALGALLRSTAGAISSLVGLVMVVPLVSSLLGSWVKTHIYPYLPSSAGGDLMAVHHATGTLQPWIGFAVMCAWAVAALALAAYGLRRRDA
jgi:ABC-type transport system involved in multi-copper enzyme maturation permease subunit